MPDRHVPSVPATVQFQPFGRRVEVATGVTLLEAAREGGLGLLSVCGGAGLCDSCRVRIVRGDVSSVTPHERDALTAEDLAAGYRLACQVTVHGDAVVDVPAESIGTEQRLQLESDDELLPDDSLSHAEETCGERLGLAVDIGTTKIAAYLVDLASSRTIAAEGTINPQVTHGEDVISRIAYADRTAGGAATLHALAVQALCGLVDRLCATSRTRREAVTEVVLVGNTVMHHLACGLPVASLGRAPYAPVVTNSLTLAARDLGLNVATDARVYLPPNLAGYIGADHVAVLIAVGPPASGRTRLVIDIGTNTEISLIAGDRIVSCSCASGPAFEGAHIGCGMRAVTGAIERVRIIGTEVRCQTIGGAAPIGICGSGVLDAVAELARHGALDRHGAFRRNHPLVACRGKDLTFVLAGGAATGHNRELVLTRHDVTEIQLAKAAIRTGIDLLLARTGIGAGAIDEVVVAGAFGSYIDLGSARRIGMLPNLPAERFRQVGNAAGAGARQLLRSRERRQAAEMLAARVEHLDLSRDSRFTETFAAAIEIPQAAKSA